MGQNIHQEAIPMNPIDRADTAFVFISAALVLLMMPGLDNYPSMEKR